MREYYQALLDSHKASGILLDSNILLLYCLGAVDPSQIPKFKRTQQFVVEDYFTLTSVLSMFRNIVTTPNILTEVSNLSGHLADPLRSTYFRFFAEAIKLLQEQQISSVSVASGDEFARFGLTDAVLHKVAIQGYLTLTDDFRLSQYLNSKRLPVINFNHIRIFNWNI